MAAAFGSEREQGRLNRPCVLIPIASVLFLQHNGLKVLVRGGQLHDLIRKFANKATLRAGRQS